MPKGPLKMSISLSTELELPTRSLLFSCDILGSVGVLPEDALSVFMTFGMSIQPLSKGEGPIKSFSDRTVMLQRYRVSWHPKSPLSIAAAQQVIQRIKQLYQKANHPGNFGEVQVLVNFPVFSHEQPADYGYIDVPWSPNFYQPNQTRLIHEILRASEIPHAFHKFGLRIYTSPVNFQVANTALANKAQGLFLKDQTNQDAYQVRLCRNQPLESSRVEVSLRSAVTSCYTTL